MVECRYRGRVIGELVQGPDGFPIYKTDRPGTITAEDVARLAWRNYRLPSIFDNLGEPKCPTGTIVRISTPSSPMT